jgi:hypothetical protein
MSVSESEARRASIRSCIVALKRDENVTVMCHHGVMVLERLMSLEQHAIGTHADRADVLRLVLDFDHVPGHSTAENAARTGETETAGYVPLEQDAYFATDQLFGGFDSGGVLNDYFYSQDDWMNWWANNLDLEYDWNRDNNLTTDYKS